MKRIGAVKYRDTSDALNRFAQVDIDTDYDDTFSISLNGTDGNGSFVTPHFIQVDNFENIAPVTITINGIKNSISPYTRTTFQINNYTPDIGIFAYEGLVTVYISESKLGIGDGSNSLASNGANNMATYVNRDGSNSMLADFDAGGFRIANVKEPIQDQDGTNRKYIDSITGVNPRTSFGAVGDGVADDSVAIQKAYDYIVANYGSGVLKLPKGTYKCAINLTSRNVDIQGITRDGVIFTPIDAVTPIMTAKWAEGSWRRVFIKNVTFQGTAPYTGVGFQQGNVPYVAGDEYSGIIEFYNVRFNSLDICVHRLYGQIGLWFSSCQFDDANYHVKTDTDVAVNMHGGCLFFDKCHIQSSVKAVCFINSPIIGSGQVIFRDCIIEANKGFVCFIENFNGSEGVPGIAFYDCWNESNSDAYYYGAPQPITNVNGVDYTTRFARIRECTPGFVFNNTPVGSLELINSSVETYSCAQSTMHSYLADANSSLYHDNPRIFSGTTFGRVRKISGISSKSGLNSPWLALSPPTTVSNSFGISAYKNDCSGVVAFTGTFNRNTVAAVGKGILPGVADAQDLTINVAETLFPTPVFSLPANSYLVTTFNAKLIAGNGVTVSINGNAGLTGACSVTDVKPQRYTNITYNAGGVINNESFYFNAISNNSVVRLFGFAIVAFGTYQEALDYANSVVFPAT